MRIGERSAWVPSMLRAEDEPCGSMTIGGHRTRQRSTIRTERSLARNA